MQGHINIQCHPLSIQSMRPFEIQTLCQNRSPEHVIQFVSLAYSLCGKAQKLAAQLALHALPTPQQQQAAQCVAIETLKEHYISMAQLLRHLELITEVQHSQALQGVGNWGAKASELHIQTTVQIIQKKYSTLLFGFEPAHLNPHKAQQALIALPSIQALFQRMVTLPTQNELPQLHQQSNIENHLLDPITWNRWVKEPALKKAVENTPFSRVSQHYPSTKEVNLPPLQQRILGKLLDIVLHFQFLAPSAPNTHYTLFGVTQQEDVTVSWVETARGRLFHMAKMNPNQTQTLNYAISAPTEWNFHPQGIAHQLIASLSKSPFDHWKKCVEQITQVIDPCVPFQIHKGPKDA